MRGCSFRVEGGLYDQNFLSYRVTTKMLTNGQTDNVITIGHPHFMRGLKKSKKIYMGILDMRADIIFW